MKHYTLRFIISILAGIFLLDSLVLITKYKLRAFDDIFDIDFDFLDELEDLDDLL